MKRTFYILILSIILAVPCFANETEHYMISATIEKNEISSDAYVYNLSNAKLHTHDCEWAEKCTKNCIYVGKNELKKMFFVPCMVCGGGVIEPMDFEK